MFLGRWAGTLFPINRGFHGEQTAGGSSKKGGFQVSFSSVNRA